MASEPRKSVYLETTILSYLAGRASRDLQIAAHQQSTWEWWNHERHRYELFVSQHVIDELRRGEPTAARRRRELATGLRSLETTTEVHELAQHLVRAHCVPRRATTDALHIAVCAVHSVDFLLTWNCRHIVNLATRPKIEAACRELGHEPPGLGTPDEPMGESGHGRRRRNRP